MHKVLRFTALAVFAAAGLTACGDKNPAQLTTTTTPAGQVQSVSVSPSTVQLNVGGTTTLVAIVTADAGVARTVTWSSSDATIASVSATGVVTGVKAGTTVILATSTADPGKQAAATVTVIAAQLPSIGLSTVNQGGQPAVLNNIAGQLDVTLNVDAGGATSYRVDLMQNCGAGDVSVASQIVAPSASKTPVGVSGVAAPVTLSYNTAAVDSTGNPLYKNGNCTLKGKLTIGTAIYSSANSTPITLNNISGFKVNSVTSANTHGGVWPASKISSLNGLVYNQGNVTLKFTAVNYATGAPIKSVTGSFMGLTFTATPDAGTQTFTVAFPNDSTQTTGFGVCVANCLGIYQYATAGLAGEAGPNITASVDTLGNQAFTSGGPLANTGFRVDNQSPLVPTTAIVNANANSNNYINGTYTLTGTGKFVSAGDPQFGATTFLIGYRSPTGYVALPAASTAYGDAYCSTAAFTTVTSMSAIPYSSTNNAYRVRVFEYDGLGNVRCTDLTESNGGVVSGVSTFGVDNKPPLIAFASAGGVGGVAANAKIVAADGTGQNFTMIYSDSGSGFNPSLPVVAKVGFNYASDSAHCSVGWKNSTQTCTQIPMAGSFQVDLVQAASGSTTGFVAAQGYYTITTHSVDQAGNPSPDSTRTALIDNTAPVLNNVSQSPASIAALGSGTFSATTTDNVDLGSFSGTLNYAPGSGAVAFAETGGTFNAGFNGTLVQSGTAAVTVSNIFKGMQGNTGGVIQGDAAVPTVTVTVKDVAGTANVGVAGNTLVPVTMAAGVTNILAGSGFVPSSSAGTVSKGAATPTSTTLTAVVTGTTVGLPNQPFANLYFYYLSGTKLVLIGSQSLAAVTDDGLGNRTWTFTLSGVTAAMLGNATTSVYAVGVDALGNAVVTNANAAAVTIVN